MMKNSRTLFFLIELTLGIVAAVLLVVLFHPENENRRVSVILSNSDADAWDSFILGMKQAARESELDLVITGTGLIGTADEEEALILQELSDGADALIVQPSPGSDTAQMLEHTVGTVPVILVPDGCLEETDSGSPIEVSQTDSGSPNGALKVYPDGSHGNSRADSGSPGETVGIETGGFPVIGPDSREMGEALAAMLIEDYSGSIDGKTIGIVNHSLNTKEAREREEGFLEGTSGSGSEVIWKLHGIEKSDQPEQEISNQSKADFVIALDSLSLEAAGTDAETRHIRGAVVYGIASSEKALYDLDHDFVRGLIFPNGYYMGYQCVREIAKKLDARFYTIRSAATPWMAVRRNDLFLEENEDLLFMQQ